MNENIQLTNTITTQTPKGCSFSDLLKEITEVVSVPEGLIRTVFAVALSTKLNLFPPLWVMLVGVPSSTKSDLVSLLRKLNFVYFIDSMTLNPFASGYKPTNKGGKTYDLLPELDQKCFIVKDYTTIFSLNEETTRKLLGELVAIYDGQFAKFSPTRGLIDYKSNFSHLGCITPAALNTHHRYLNIVGPRFMFYRIPDLTEDRRKKGFEIAWGRQDRKHLLEEVADKVVGYFNGLSVDQSSVFHIEDQQTRNTLEKLSSLMGRSRGIIILQKASFTNEEGKEITYYDIVDRQIEEPWRAFQQLRGLAITLAIMDGRKEIKPQDIEILRHIVISSMPAERAEILIYFLDHDSLTTKQLSEATGKSIRTCQRLLKELEGLNIVKSDLTDLMGKFYTLEDDFKILTEEKNGQAPSEFMSPIIPDKTVTNYTNDELEGVLVFIKDELQNNLLLTEEIKEKYLALAEEIFEEGKKRGLNTSDLSVSDQLLINNTVDGGER